MKIDVLIEYNEKLSEVTFSSQATQFIQTRPARIGLSHPKYEKYDYEIVEFVGEDWEAIEKIPNLFLNDPSRKDWILRIINPFELPTFEPMPLFRMIEIFCLNILAKFYPKSWTWRMNFSLFNKYEIFLKIPDYKYFNPQKKSEFEKLLRKKYKNVNFVS